MRGFFVSDIKPGRPAGEDGPVKGNIGSGQAVYAFFRVRKTPIMAPIRRSGEERMNSHSNMRKAVPVMARSGSW